MKRVLSIGLLLIVLSRCVLGGSSLKIRPLDKSAPKGFASIFSKWVDVFGIRVYATDKTPDKKVLHAANVLGQYLDNNADGRPDNELVIRALRKSKGAVVMFSTERKANAILKDIHRHIPEEVWNEMYAVGLYGAETHPGGARRGVFDATYEEVLHLITAAGYAKAYPDVFGEKAGSAIAKAMDKARGGHFRKVPTRYPEGAWFTYYDKSCDYTCQITEYIYWGITSILGAQEFPGRLDNISGEWRLNTAAKVKEGDPALYKLLTDPKYLFPTKLPDGKYRPRKKGSKGTDSSPKARRTAEQGAPADADRPRR